MLRAFICACILCFTGPSIAWAGNDTDDDVAVAAPPSGSVRVVNRSARTVTVRGNNFVGRDGGVRDLNAFWRIQPHSTVLLQLNDNPLFASRFDARLETSGGSTHWSWGGPLRDGALPVFFGDDSLPPPESVVGNVGQEGDGPSTFDFAIPGGPQTLVLYGVNTSGGSAISIKVVDARGNVVSRSAQQGPGSARCMLSSLEQGQYTLVVGSGDSAPAEYSVRFTSISHVDVLGSALADELAKAAIATVLVKVAGTKADEDQLSAQMSSDFKRDAFSLAVIESLMQFQGRFPDADPLVLVRGRLADLLRGDDDKFLNVRSNFVSRLGARIRAALSR